MSTTDTQPTRLVEHILAAFDQHYQIFRSYCTRAHQGFLSAQWLEMQAIHHDRVDLYDAQVDLCVSSLRELEDGLDPQNWQGVKSLFSEQLRNHPQPDLAETFFNSVFCRLFDRRYYNNEYIFVESDALWRHYETDEKLVRRYSVNGNLETTLLQLLNDVDIGLPFENATRDVRHLIQRFRGQEPELARTATTYSIDLITAPFFRNKACYLIGRLNLANRTLPFIVPVSTMKLATSSPTPCCLTAMPWPLFSVLPARTSLSIPVVQWP